MLRNTSLMDKCANNTPDVMRYNIEKLTDVTSKPTCGSIISTAHTSRLETQPYEDVNTVSDIFTQDDAVCHFLRFSSSAAPHAISFTGPYNIMTVGCGGWLIYPTDKTDHIYWVPLSPCLRQTDNIGHILNEETPTINGISIDNENFTVEFASSPNGFTDIIIWKFNGNNTKWIGYLNNITNLDTSKYYTWGSHTNITKPADLYLHVCYGNVYENRKLWPKFWKIYSENDAHSLFVIFSGLENSSTSGIYPLLKHQIVISIISRQANDGGWHHGEWTDDMESHFRLHCSAMHLLMDAYEEYRDDAILACLKRAAAFISRQKDKLHSGDWYLHDELETNIELLNKGPFRWLSSRAYGKSPSNMLVLNTQLDTIIALDRYQEITDDKQYIHSIKSACNATKTILESRPAEWLYRPLFWAIGLTLVPTKTAEQLPIPLRAIKRLAWKYLIPVLPYIKRIFPRIVMPGGYIDRELSLKIWAHEYMSINMVDLLRYYRRFPDKYLLEVINAGVNFIQDTKIYDRWAELKGKEYSIGFWCEALYHLCMIDPSEKCRIWLAETMLILDKHGFGLPPSLLGGNSEAIPFSQQQPCPSIEQGPLRVANLSYGSRLEYVLVNTHSEDISLEPSLMQIPSLYWKTSNEPTITKEGVVIVPARGWSHGFLDDNNTRGNLCV